VITNTHGELVSIERHNSLGIDIILGGIFIKWALNRSLIERNIGKGAIILNTEANYDYYKLMYLQT